jgi:hypothetical protein
MKIGLRFYLSWIFSALVMFVLFYVWHGIFLNDFKRIQFPITWFVSFAAFTYLIFGALLFFMMESEPAKKIRNVFVRALVVGAIAGFTLFMIATIINFSLTRTQSANHLLMDCVWQISEQMVGALVVTALKLIIHEPQHEHA